MLNTIPTPAHIVRTFEAIEDLADISAGIAWYEDAYGIAQTLGIVYGVSTAQAAGIISALSPQQSWAQNVKTAERFLADPTVRVHTESNMSKCRRILAGENIEKVLNAPKTTNFYLSIKSLGYEGVCIDRHAIDIALGVRHTDKSRPVIGARLYRDAVQAYVDAAAILNRMGADITPAMLQSVTWEAHVKVWSGVRHEEPIAI